MFVLAERAWAIAARSEDARSFRFMCDGCGLGSTKTSNRRFSFFAVHQFHSLSDITKVVVSMERRIYIRNC